MTRPCPLVAPGRLLDDDVLQPLTAAWGARFGDPLPWVAGRLVRALLVSVAAPAPPGVALREAAAGLAVLRARQGHAAPVLLEDLLALRPVVEERTGPDPAGLTAGLEEALRVGVAAHSAEAAMIARPTRDPLLHVLTRGALLEALEHQVTAAARFGAPSLVLLDLDGLVRFSDEQGHLAADLHLVRTTGILLASSRRSDLPGRLGVEQLAVVLPRTDLPRALVVARRVLARSLADARAAERAAPGSSRALPRLSVGVAWLPAPSSGGELLGAAEQAIGRARARGGGVVESTRLPLAATG